MDRRRRKSSAVKNDVAPEGFQYSARHINWCCAAISTARASTVRARVDDDLKSLLESSGLKPTRGGNLLDVVSYDDRGLVSGVDIDDVALISDHRFVHFKIRARRPAVRPVEVTSPKSRNIDVSTFEQTLHTSAFFSDLLQPPIRSPNN